MFGLLWIWGLRLNRGVCVTEVLILGHYKLNSSITLGLLSILVKSFLKLCEFIESVGIVGLVCAKSVKESQTS